MLAFEPFTYNDVNTKKSLYLDGRQGRSDGGTLSDGGALDLHEVCSSLLSGPLLQFPWSASLSRLHGPPRPGGGLRRPGGERRRPGGGLRPGGDARPPVGENLPWGDRLLPGGDGERRHERPSSLRQ